MAFFNLGTRNKGTFFEYLSAYSFLTTKHPHTTFEVDSFFAYAEGIQNQHYQDTEVIDRYVKDLFWKEFSAGIYTEDFFAQLAEVYLSPMRNFEAVLAKTELLKCSNGELADLCTLGAVSGSTCLKPMLQGMVLMYLSPEFEERLRIVLTGAERKDNALVLETMTLLLTVPKENFYDNEETALRKIEENFWNKYPEYADSTFSEFIGQPETRSSISDLVKNFGWFHMEYMQEPFTEKEYEVEISRRLQTGKNIGPLPRIVKDEIREKQKAFFSSHAKSEELEELVRVMHGFTHVYDESKVILVRDNFLLQPLLTEIAGRLDVTWSDILYLVPPEIVTLLRSDKKADKGRIKTRFNNRAILLRGGLITWYQGNEAKRVRDELAPVEKEENNGTSVKGIIAYPGIVRGKVRIIRSGKDSFSAGDILVTHDGTAELTLFLKQASAIVTNEGGMICHCSIVAREIKTPCIVGTKNATKIFKDGDMVEVDATKGTVKLI